MKEIQLTQGKVALVDNKDYEWLNQWKWQYQKSPNSGYAARTDGKRPHRKAVLMHSQIMSTPSGMEVDHKDRNGLNNQRANLRICTHSQNMRNQPSHQNNKSGFRGVVWQAKCNKWAAQIMVNYKHIHLGLFSNIETAAHAYDKAARKYFGDFARFNFPHQTGE